MAMTAWDPNRKRRCRSTHPDDSTLQCQGEVTDLSTHIEDHYALSAPGVTVRWDHLGRPIDSLAQPFGDHDIGAKVLAEAGARHQQVGGDHYRTMKIQPWEIIDAHGLGYYAGSCLKYLLRAGRKGPKLEDLKKARHYLDKMIELEEGGE